jgi:pilus assembly protein Flp/PilA
MKTSLITRVRKLGTAIKNFLAGKEEGASIVEYALLVALVAIVCVTALSLLGSRVVDVFNSITSSL